MNNRFFISGISICLLLCFSSCTEEIELSPESLITVNSFWKTPEDARGGLYGMYNQLRDEARANLQLYGESRSEVMNHGLQNASTRVKFFENTMDASNADLDWLRLYRIIDYANLVIKFVPDIEFPDVDAKNNMLAQAYSMRAFAYFVMARTWGDVPILTEPIEGYDAETTFVARSPVSEVFGMIKGDIETALGLYPNNDFPAGRSLWSKPAVNVLKGDVFLWTGKVLNGGAADFTTALSALEAAESESLTLLEDFSSIFEYGNKGNDEILFAVRFADLEASDNYFVDMSIGGQDLADSNIPADIKTRLGDAGGLNYWAPNALMRDQFTSDDQRKDASFVEVYTVVDGDSTFLTSVTVKCRGFEEAGSRKFLDDIVIYRYGELLLLKAEAKNALGMDPSEEMNAIRMRAYGADFAAHEFVNGSQEENDEAILQERLFELVFEGKRWWDLVRFDKAFEKLPTLQDKVGQDHLLFWPISQSTISLNSKLVQTAGY